LPDFEASATFAFRLPAVCETPAAVNPANTTPNPASKPSRFIMFVIMNIPYGGLTRLATKLPEPLPCW
jgi:hypothetical protein